MGVSSTALHMSSSSKVKLMIASAKHDADRQLGLSEALVNRLVSSPAERHLKALKELYLNFWRMYSVFAL